MLPPPIGDARSDGRPQLVQVQSMSGWRATPPIAPKLGIERASALHVQRLACSSLRFPSLLRRNPQRSAAQRSRNLHRPAQHQQPSRSPERPHRAVRRRRSRHLQSPSACERLAWHLRHPLAAPSQPALVVEAAQPPRAEKRRPRRRRRRRPVAFAGHPTAVLRPAECTSHSAGRRAR